MSQTTVERIERIIKDDRNPGAWEIAEEIDRLMRERDESKAAAEAWAMMNRLREEGWSVEYSFAHARASLAKATS